MNMTIERASSQDLDNIINIEYNLEHSILSPILLSSSLNKDTYYYFVAKLDNTIVGYLAAELLVDHFDLLAIAVLKDFRRQNIATLLLNKLFAICNDLNISDVFLEVRTTNLSAINFYEKMGFKVISTRKNYYTDTNEDAYIYKKEV